MDGPKCSWCGVDIGRDEGFRATEPEGERRAAFCRLEHVVPWVIRGAAWEPAADDARGVAATAGATPAGAAERADRCAVCDSPLGPDRVDIVRERGAHHIADAVCSTEHLLAWAKAGGRYTTR